MEIEMSDQKPENTFQIDPIERAVQARLDQLETEMSRLRSVIYLLVKDKPEMLRLLG